MAKHSTMIIDLARRGAEARIKELEAELEQLRKLVTPTLTIQRRGRPRGAAATLRVSQEATAATVPTTTRTRKHRRMSANQRMAVSARMKRYWASRRKQKKG